MDIQSIVLLVAFVIICFALMLFKRRLLSYLKKRSETHEHSNCWWS